MIKLELISSAGCKKCATARNELKAAAEDFAQGEVEWRDVNVLDELDYAVSLGVLTLPAVAINGTLVFTSLPTPERLRAELAKHIRK